MRRDDFQTLCEGGVSEARANRDLCLGIFFTSAVGLAGVLMTADWEYEWKPEKRTLFLLFASILLVTVAGSFVGAVIYDFHRRKIVKNSPYSRLVIRLGKQYDAQTGCTATVDTAASLAALTILSAQYGVEGRYSDVTSVLAALVENSQLNVVVGNHLCPDPCPGVPKQLVVRYLHNGQMRVQTTHENETLSIP